jgi:hypothetical protein
VVAHNSAADLKDKTPLQAYQGATVTQLATAARVTQGAEATVNSGTISGANILTRIVSSTPASSLDLATSGATTLISKLSLENKDDSFEFTVINLHASNVATLVDSAAGVTLVGAGAVAGASSAQFRVRRTSVIGAGDAVKIYRVA